MSLFTLINTQGLICGGNCHIYKLEKTIPSTIYLASIAGTHERVTKAAFMSLKELTTLHVIAPMMTS